MRRQCCGAMREKVDAIMADQDGPYDSGSTPEPLLARDDSPDPNKLIPEWRVAADDQIIVIAVGVLAAILAVMGWNAWRSDDGDLSATTSTVTIGEAGADVAAPVVALPAAPDPGSSGDNGATADTSTSTTAETPTTTEESTTTEVESTAAESLDLEPETVAALTGAGVVEAAAQADASDDTVLTVRGVVGNETEAAAALAAAEDVPGVTGIVDELTVLQPDVQAALAGSGCSRRRPRSTGLSQLLEGPSHRPKPAMQLWRQPATYRG